MSHFGIGLSIVAIALSAGLTAQTSGSQVRDPADAKSSQTAAPVPWLDPSLANSSDRAKMLAISVATVHSCSAGSSAICYGLCAPNPDQANSEQPAVGKSAPIKQLDAIKNKATTPVLSTENRKPKN
jgi:hypothetical protein